MKSFVWARVYRASCAPGAGVTTVKNIAVLLGRIEKVEGTSCAFVHYNGGIPPRLRIECLKNV